MSKDGREDSAPPWKKGFNRLRNFENSYWKSGQAMLNTYTHTNITHSHMHRHTKTHTQTIQKFNTTILLQNSKLIQLFF